MAGESETWQFQLKYAIMAFLLGKMDIALFGEVCSCTAILFWTHVLCMLSEDLHALGWLLMRISLVQQCHIIMKLHSTYDSSNLDLTMICRLKKTQFHWMWCDLTTKKQFLVIINNAWISKSVSLICHVVIFFTPIDLLVFTLRVTYLILFFCTLHAVCLPCSVNKCQVLPVANNLVGQGQGQELLAWLPTSSPIQWHVFHHFSIHHIEYWSCKQQYGWKMHSLKEKKK